MFETICLKVTELLSQGKPGAAGSALSGAVDKLSSKEFKEVEKMIKEHSKRHGVNKGSDFPAFSGKTISHGSVTVR